ncbi:MAG: RnfABCDGE type electron transport complex subunit D, partial [Clostridia bacterium]|nr:RnfABCDGE type electron transport complex subunit D [Clostridia bacterium]
MEKLVVSSSPHIHSGASTQRIMLDVIIALLPASVAAVVLFGLKAFVLIAVSVATAVISEFLFNLITKKKQTVGDLSAVITGLLLALSLPATTTVWQIIVGAAFAIVVVKCLFGGIGCNFANPAVTARIMMLIAFGASIGGGTNPTIVDMNAGATPLAAIKS